MKANCSVSGKMQSVIARRPKADVAISYPSKDRARSSAKAPHGDAHSLDVDELLACAGRRVVGLDLAWSRATAGGGKVLLVIDL